MPWTGSAPSQQYTRSDGTRTGSAVNVTADGAGVNNTALLADNRENDFATALSLCLKVDGGTQPSANLPMNTKKFTGMAQGSARTDSIRLDQCQDGDLIYAGTVGGTANAIELTMTPASGGGVEGMMVLFIPGSDNTSSVTVDLDGSGAEALELNSAALVGGELQAGQPAIIAHDGTNWQLVTASALAVLASVANGRGASLIGVEDSAGNFDQATVEAVLAEIIADYAATTNGNGASKIGIEDSGGLITATTVEGALAENRTAIDAAENRIVPSGAIMAWPTGTAPSNWLECDGSAVSRTTYSALFAVIGETYGNGDGSTTFNLPDLRGEFIRGFDNSAGNDPDAASRTDRGDGTTGDNVGTKQDFALENVTGEFSHTVGDGSGNRTGTGPFTDNADGNHSGGGGGTVGRVTFDLSNTAQTSTETRPRNVAMMWIIKT